MSGYDGYYGNDGYEWLMVMDGYGFGWLWMVSDCYGNSQETAE